MTSPSELRKDPISGRWVIIATERSKRPDEFRSERWPPRRKPGAALFCPFCPGNEAKTPPEIYAVPGVGASPGGAGWRVRVVPNKFPALTRGETPIRSRRGLFESLDGIGVHEVIIESPDHDKDLPDLPPDHVRDILSACQSRFRSIEAEPQYAYIQLFKNKGPEAGASLSHPHSQIVATPIIPKRVKEEIFASERHFRRTGKCLFCRTLVEEIEAGERIVRANGHFAAVAPFASRFPFEMRIFPRRHSPYFSAAAPEEIAALGEILQAVLSTLKSILDDPPFNIILHQGPHPARAREISPDIDRIAHWYIEIIPVLTRIAGFEWGTGFYINPVVPEDAARFLRG
jgi:UDPglucose--hexose-1-phosphate uridylyltransferase